MISVYGASGFIGSKFIERYPDSIAIPKTRNNTDTNNILYLISTTDNYNIFEKTHLDVDTNLTKLIDVLDSISHNENITFNFVSSWFVYGKNQTLPITENALCDPRGMYSITKRAAEQIVRTYAETFKFNYRILRLTNIIGEGDWKNVNKKKNALQFMIKTLLDNGNVSLYDDGDCIRDFMYVDDAVDALKLCADKAPVNEVINISNNDPRKIGDIIRSIKEKYNTGNVTSMPTPDFHKIVQIKDAYLDNSKLKSYGYTQKVSFDDAIDRIVKDYNERRNTSKN